MLLQTNSYIVPKEKRSEHARLLQRFKQLLAKHGCEHFEAYEQVGANWAGSEPTGRFVQIMRFNDRQQWLSVQQAEKNDPQAKQLITEFCELVNLPYQMQAGLFSAVYFTGVITHHPPRPSTLPKLPQATAAAGGAAAPGLPATDEAPSGHTGDSPSAIELEADADSGAEAAAAELLAGETQSEDIFDQPTHGHAASTDPAAGTEEAALDALADDSSPLDALAGVDQNGESDVLEYLVDSEPAAADEPERQRID